MGRSRGRGHRFRGPRGQNRPQQKPKDIQKGGEHVNKLQPRIDYSGLPRDDDQSLAGAGAIAPELLLPVPPPRSEAAEETEAETKVATKVARTPKRGAKSFDAVEGIVEGATASDDEDPNPKKTRGRGRKAAAPRGRRDRAEAIETSPVEAPARLTAASAYASAPAAGAVAPRASAVSSSAEGAISQRTMSQDPMTASGMAAPAPQIPPLTDIPKKLLDSGALSIPKILRMSLTELLEECQKEEVQELANTQKDYIAGVVIRARLRKHGFMLTDGCLEVLPEGFGFLRPQFNDYLPNPDDVFVSQNLIRRYGLKTGHMITGAVRPARESEKYLALARVDLVNGHDPNLVATKTPFEELTPLYPNQRLGLETDHEILETRIVDLISPIGKGQRGLIVSPPRAGKTILLQKIANAISTNNPECHLLVLLVDERPEEVTDMERTIRGEVIASTFDEPASRHVQVAHMVLQKAKRLVEFGVDVVILLDSITRLARAHNIETPGSSKILSGGIDAGALQKPKQFFGAARNIEEGGSLTILGTALVDTGSRMDEVIFEEFKGTGNMELVLDRRLADRRIYPALDINMSGTRREDLLMNEDEKQRVWVLRRFMNDIVDPVEAMDLLLEKMGKTKSNAEFLLGMNLDK